MRDLSTLTDQEFYDQYESVAECACEARGEIARFGDCYPGGQADISKELAFAREHKRRLEANPPMTLVTACDDIPF